MRRVLLRRIGWRFLEAAKQIAFAKGTTPSQIAIAWLLVQKPWIVPIPGTCKRSRLKENIGATTLSLTAADIAAIERAVSAHSVEGDRYSADAMASLNL